MESVWYPWIPNDTFIEHETIDMKEPCCESFSKCSRGTGLDRFAPGARLKALEPSGAELFHGFNGFQWISMDFNGSMISNALLKFINCHQMIQMIPKWSKCCTQLPITKEISLKKHPPSSRWDTGNRHRFSRNTQRWRWPAPGTRLAWERMERKAGAEVPPWDPWDA